MRLDDLPVPEITTTVALPRIGEVTVRALGQAERLAIADALAPRLPRAEDVGEARMNEAYLRFNYERGVVAVAVAMGLDMPSGAWDMTGFGRASPVGADGRPEAPRDRDRAAAIARRDYAANAVDALAGGETGRGRLTHGEVNALLDAVVALEGLDPVKAAAKNSSSPPAPPAGGTDCPPPTPTPA